jgi:hypothetical protein
MTDSPSLRHECTSHTACAPCPCSGDLLPSLTQLEALQGSPAAPAAQLAQLFAQLQPALGPALLADPGLLLELSCAKELAAFMAQVAGQDLRRLIDGAEEHGDGFVRSDTLAEFLQVGARLGHAYYSAACCCWLLAVCIGGPAQLSALLATGSPPFCCRLPPVRASQVRPFLWLETLPHTCPCLPFCPLQLAPAMDRMLACKGKPLEELLLATAPASDAAAAGPGQQPQGHSPLSARLRLCNEHVHSLRQLYASLANRSEVTRQVVQGLLERGCFRFDIRADQLGGCDAGRVACRLPPAAAGAAEAAVAGTAGAATGRWYSLPDLEELRSRVRLLMNSSSVAGAAAAALAGGDGTAASFSNELMAQFVLLVDHTANIVRLAGQLADEGHLVYKEVVLEVQPGEGQAVLHKCQ